MGRQVQWVKRWSILMSDKPVLPGVWKRKDGGYVVRARVINPKSGRQVEILRVLAHETDPKRALMWLTTERDRVRAGKSGPAVAIPIWKSFAASLFQDKVADRSISTASGRKKWARILEHHLFTAPWSTFYVDQVAHADLVEWRAEIAKMGWTRHVPSKDGAPRLAAKGERYSPNTLNDWLNIARVIWKAAKHKFQLSINPMDGVEDFSTAGHRTYTAEEPNALAMAEVSRWLVAAKRLYPQFYAMIFLGLVLGHRPSTLRPLRRSGPTPDIDWKTGEILIRRSNTVKDEVEDFTKTKRDQRIMLPRTVLEVLKWHRDTQMVTWQMRESELLFPNQDGGFRSRSCLDKPFDKITEAAGIKKQLTPRALRRTFQDLSREAKLEGVVAKAISGHETDAMRILYSTAQTDEVTRGIAKVVGLASKSSKKRKAG
jgi:hypothetical protein